MKYWQFTPVMMLALVVTGAPLPGAAAASEAATGVTLSMEKGTVALEPATALSDGRLVIKVVALNRGTAPAALNAADISLQTSANKPVALVPVETLISEAQAASDPHTARMSSGMEHQPGNYAHNDNAALRNSAGQVVGSNMGSVLSGQSVNRDADSPSGSAPTAAQAKAELDQQIAALKAGVLQTLTIAPGGTGGAQIVTEKLRFARRELRVLKIAVKFNGENYDFRVDVPRD